MLLNWCDAYAYCAGVGKRLCGKIGGGPIGPFDFAEIESSQWYAACTSNGADAYPYGQTYSGRFRRHEPRHRQFGHRVPLPLTLTLGVDRRAVRDAEGCVVIFRGA